MTELKEKNHIKKDEPYKKLLKKMLRIEVLGEKFYDALVSKTKDVELKIAYQKLALNEHQTAEHIRKELLLFKQDGNVSDGIFITIMQFIFNLLPARLLSFILKVILKKRMYSGWFKTNRDTDQQFWDLLLQHENVQHELLGRYWEREEKSS